MSSELIVLLIVVVTALAFDFTNGFHDTANAMATSIATGALGPRVAVAMSAVLNLVGAFLSVEVAKTVSGGLLNIGGVNHMAMLHIVFAGLIGGILWNLLTWLLGLPSSSTHALFGGLIGAAVAALGASGVIWTGNQSTGVLNKIIVPAVLAPFVAALVAGLGTFLVYRITRRAAEAKVRTGFRLGQIGSAALVSLAHGTNDAQKTMGVIFMALVAHGTYTASDNIPMWVKICCALAIALGTYLGGWRIIRTLGKGLVEIDPPQGFAAESSSAAIILTSAQFGLPLSTTQTATGSILGTGLGKAGAVVRWGVMGRMAVAWLLTLPLAALAGALCWGVAHLIGGLGGVLVDTAILVALSAYLYLRSRRSPVDTRNVNEEWEGGLTPPSSLAESPAGTAV
ncbi:inorganic phosphate transporter [Nocardia terpenica]|uniref:inorganic phosphate transporter n=1 Tax=Nocardia terpenica TaxID=455432 RepID=UPI0018963559|nr:inorganic phosphate transporter [Nocardia terpenica]MBF6064293.1 inorganic phosphate transporter [Nocardia terpenica]MBF6106626.1 inorganic phosphate transporter [Nocardia terpenica]MBF6113911.1 inorganic phosphate transporter [Nocardia terpenica]MBF6120465.1 inorganic phosphate transporter [Nocardia terpenica]MBF6154878.1 inorganic phosphate transporter [Nocardia terpenica]